MSCRRRTIPPPGREAAPAAVRQAQVVPLTVKPVGAAFVTFHEPLKPSDVLPPAGIVPLQLTLCGASVGDEAEDGAAQFAEWRRRRCSSNRSANSASTSSGTGRGAINTTTPHSGHALISHIGSSSPAGSISTPVTSRPVPAPASLKPAGPGWTGGSAERADVVTPVACWCSGTGMAQVLVQLSPLTDVAGVPEARKPNDVDAPAARAPL